MEESFSRRVIRVRMRDSQLRRAALERDGFMCQLCGLRPDTPAVLQAAHLRPQTDAGAVTRLEDVLTLCANCHAKFDASADREYIADIIRASPGAIVGFKSALAKVRSLNAVDLPAPELEVALRNLLFANVIAALETYLADTIVAAISRERQLVQRALKKVPELRERKVALCDLFDRLDEIDKEVRGYFLDLVYHNLGKVKPLYSSVLSVRLPADMRDVIGAINKRHDIVHRNGKSKDGIQIATTSADVESVATLVEQFVEQVELQVQAKPWRTDAG